MWGGGAESRSAKIAQLQDDFAEEQLYNLGVNCVLVKAEGEVQANLPSLLKGAEGGVGLSIPQLARLSVV